MKRSTVRVSSPQAGVKLALAAVKVDPKSQFPAGGDEALKRLAMPALARSVPRRRG